MSSGLVDVTGSRKEIRETFLGIITHLVTITRDSLITQDFETSQKNLVMFFRK